MDSSLSPLIESIPQKQLRRRGTLILGSSTTGKRKAIMAYRNENNKKGILVQFLVDLPVDVMKLERVTNLAKEITSFPH